MPTSRELAGATTWVPQGTSEAYRNDIYDPRSMVMPPSAEALAADDEEEEEDENEEDAAIFGAMAMESLKEYFANPTDNLKKLIGDKKYTGTIDNKPNLEICVLASELEAAIEEVVGEDVSGLVLMDDPAGVESAIDVVLKYEKAKSSTQKTTMDDRFYQLSKILVQSGVSK